MASETNSRASSPDKGLASILRRSSKRDSRSSSQISLGSNDNAANNRRNSLRVGLDKLKDNTSRRMSSDHEPRDGESPSRLSRLIHATSRHKSRGGDQAVNNEIDNIERNSLSRRLGKGISRGIVQGDSTSLQVAGDDSKLNVNASTESFGPTKSTASSLLTEDSDPDASPLRPTLASRQSHKALLTFNSPLIATEVVPLPTDYEDTAAAPLLHSTATPLPTTTSAVDDLSSPEPPLSTKSSSDIIPARIIPPTILAESGTDNLDSTLPPSNPGTPRAAVFRKNIAQGLESGSITPQSQQSSRLTLSPTSSDYSPPPATFITPPTPTLGREPSPPTGAAQHLGPLSAKQVAKPSKDIAHRRTRSATTASSKLSNQIAPPLTPTVEESKTPGGSLITPSGSSGFFSSVFSATNNAINQLSNTFQINNSQNPRSRSGTSTSEPDKLVGAEEVILNSRAQTRDGPVQVEPAVKTLGSGNLSLSHLGISDTSQDHSPMSSQIDLSNGFAHSPSLANFSMEKEEASAAAAVDAAYTEKPGTPVVKDNLPTVRPMSISSAVNSIPGDHTPPRRDTFSETNALHRSGSVRSRFSGRKKKRSRGSSAATGSAIAAALASSSSALVNPGLGAQRTTGFAVASGKRNKDFHTLFKSVPEDDYLIEDYSAALQRDILLHGRMYVSERHICFSSNILGWQTNLVISFDEVVAMEKKSTAMIFPNAIVIQTLHAKNVFASFLSRDPTYDLLVGIWKIGHPNLKTSDNGHVLDDQAKSDVAESIDDDDESGESDFSGEDGDSQEPGSFIEATSSLGGSEPGDVPRVPSQKITKSDNSNGVTASPVKGTDGAPTSVTDYPGLSSHAPTECADQENHYDKEVQDTTIPAPLGRVYDMMFGPKSGSVMRKFLVDDQNSRELDMEDDKTGMGEQVKTFSYSYIKPLNASIGPKQTKCIVTQTLDAFDLDKAVSVTCSTQTPDVPSGNVFVTKTKYCLMWGPGNSTRFIMNCTVEWSGKSWLKGPIEKGANDGQTQYGKDIVRFFTAQVSSKVAKGPKTGGTKLKNKKRRTPTNGSEELKEGAKSASAARNSASLSPLGELLSSILTPVFGLSVLLLMMTVLWLRSGPSTKQGTPRLHGGNHASAYEELWRREENQLWDWLEDRLALDDIAPPVRTFSDRRQVLLSPELGYGETEKKNEKQMDEAIRITEESTLPQLRAYGPTYRFPVGVAWRDQQSLRHHPYISHEQVALLHTLLCSILRFPRPNNLTSRYPTAPVLSAMPLILDSPSVTPPTSLSDVCPTPPSKASAEPTDTNEQRRRQHHEADVLVIGAGVFGSALAFALGQQGRSVILLEKSLKQPDRIVGELLQPGGVAALESLGLRDCLEDIDAIRVKGYDVIYYGQGVPIPYPEDASRKGQGRPEGRSFHHGRFVQKLRERAMAAPNVSVVETTATDLVRSSYTGQVLGVQCQSGANSDFYFAPLTIVADGYASSFRKSVHPYQPTSTSKFYALELTDCPLPFPMHGHVVLGAGAPVLLYQIGTHETRVLVDVPHNTPSAATARGGIKGHLRNVVLPDLPEVVKPSFDAALQKVEAGGAGNILRSMPNSFLPSTTKANATPGFLLLGDALNMRHPLTGGGMTVALSDVVLLAELLSPLALPSLDAPERIAAQMRIFHWRRKGWSSVINILAQALYALFAADDAQLKTLQMGCFRYFQLGGQCIDGPVGLLAGIIKQPLVLIGHFFAVAIYAIYIYVVEGSRAIPGNGNASKNRGAAASSLKHIITIPLRLIASTAVFWKACVVIVPYLFAELRT
ncbi:hypothetical protein FH972_026648 [Carpinus fangiana]|uniref:Squalene epoxidase ERG1 n=1 Tax=Carpinus fangiana TaxID=176857 RepID=A0A5N6L4Z7_9ROSI|nr:hypothetical protein FH972_026648 [Carpinus fangiana]